MSAAAVHAILLAAGAGRRLGGPKAALHLRGEWMLPRLIQSLRAGGVARVVLVLSEDALEAIADLGHPGADVECVNPDPAAGRTGSIRCGLAAVPADTGLLVHPCDMPLLQPASVRAVLDAWRAASAPAEALVRPVSAGRRGGHPLLIGPAWRTWLEASGPDRPLRELLREDPAALREVPLADPGAFLDVNTPEQLALLEGLLSP